MLDSHAGEVRAARHFVPKRSWSERPLSEWQSVWVELIGAEVQQIQGRRWVHRIIRAGDSGDALVLIHGVGGHAEAWARNVMQLAKTFQVIAVDAVFHGLSGKNDFNDERSWEIEADGLVDLLDALGIERAHVEGESLGAFIAFEFGLKYPDRCMKLILNTGTGPVAFSRSDFDEQPGGGSDTTLAELSAAALVQPTVENMTARMQWLVARPDRMTLEMIRIRLALYQRPDVLASMQRVYAADKRYREFLRLNEADCARLKQETLVFWTEHNPGEGPDVGEYLATLLPNAMFYCMADAGHWPQWEHPEEHDAVVTQFLLGASGV